MQVSIPTRNGWSGTHMKASNLILTLVQLQAPRTTFRAYADLTNHTTQQHEVIEEVKFRQDELDERL